MRQPRSDVDTSKLYETLGVEKGCEASDIKKAYRKLSLKHHPDRGGDEHKFKEINAAYEILSDPEQRAKYDKYGLEGIGDDGHGHSGEDLFSMFFGGGSRRRSAGPRKGPSINHPLKVSLEDLYNGKTVKLAVNRKVIVGAVKTCDKCRGQGVVTEIRQIGPGMITQVQRQCDTCGGTGSMAERKTERKVLEVHVDKGMSHNQKITFTGMADENPNMEPGDINFVIQEKDHDLFKRKGADLLVTKNLSLNQALCGFAWKIRHLDGRDLVVKTRPGEIIHSEVMEAGTGRVLPFIKMVPNEGMPSHGNPFVKGNLYVAFQISFPDSLSLETVEALKKLLPGADMPEDYDPDEVEECFMEKADLKHFGKGGASNHGNEYDEDEDDGQPQGVQCQQS